LFTIRETYNLVANQDPAWATKNFIKLGLHVVGVLRPGGLLAGRYETTSFSSPASSASSAAAISAAASRRACSTVREFALYYEAPRWLT
jgi:hypothetical protein